MIAKWIQWPKVHHRTVKRDFDKDWWYRDGEERFPSKKFDTQAVRRARKLEHEIACAIGRYQEQDIKA